MEHLYYLIIVTAIIIEYLLSSITSILDIKNITPIIPPDFKEAYDQATNTFSSNPNYHSSAFGEAKGANLVNAPYLGPTPFKGSNNPLLSTIDYGAGAAQLAAGNTINSVYQLLQEGGKAVKNQGWKGLINTDWLKNAYADVVEEGNAFNRARFADNMPTTPKTLWDFGNSVDDANVIPPPPAAPVVPTGQLY